MKVIDDDLVQYTVDGINAKIDQLERLRADLLADPAEAKPAARRRPLTGSPATRKRRLSAEQKQAISRRMKAYWRDQKRG